MGAKAEKACVAFALLFFAGLIAYTFLSNAESKVTEVVCSDWEQQEISTSPGVEAPLIYARRCFCRDYDKNGFCGDELIQKEEGI